MNGFPKFPIVYAAFIAGMFVFDNYSPLSEFLGTVFSLFFFLGAMIAMWQVGRWFDQEPAVCADCGRITRLYAMGPFCKTCHYQTRAWQGRFLDRAARTMFSDRELEIYSQHDKPNPPASSNPKENS